MGPAMGLNMLPFKYLSQPVVFVQAEPVWIMCPTSVKRHCKRIVKANVKKSC